jgi:hypothetical protein
MDGRSSGKVCLESVQSPDSLGNKKKYLTSLPHAHGL